MIYSHILKFPIKNIIPYKSSTKCLSHLGLLLLWWLWGAHTISHLCPALTSRAHPREFTNSRCVTPQVTHPDTKIPPKSIVPLPSSFPPSPVPLVAPELSLGCTNPGQVPSEPLGWPGMLL